jgi:hypothetical protein
MDIFKILLKEGEKDEKNTNGFSYVVTMDRHM